MVRGGSLTFWVDEAAEQPWCEIAGTGPLGERPRIDDDTAIESALALRAVFHLSLRAI